MWGLLRILPVHLGALLLLPLMPTGAWGQEYAQHRSSFRVRASLFSFSNRISLHTAYLDPGPWSLQSQPARAQPNFGIPEAEPSGTFLYAEASEPAPFQSFQPRIPGPGRPFLYSAVLPGLGQRVMGQDRWTAYLAGEAWAWIQFFTRRRQGHALQREYRELAWLVARRVSSGPRVDGNFEYYEAMTKFVSSGAFDANPGHAGVQPEDNPESYNGAIWALAREIFFLDDPENPVQEDSDQFQDALRYYRSRAYAPDFTWNWGSNTLQQDEFTALIRSSDENLRRSTTMIGVILANHLLSAVDALVSGRLGQVDSAGPRIQLHLVPGPSRQDLFFLTVRIPSN